MQIRIKQVDQTKRGRECTQELGVLMDQLRSMLPEEHLDSDQEKGGTGLPEGFWKDVRAQLLIKEEEVYGEKLEP